MTYFEDLLDAIHLTMSLLTLREENVLNHSTLVLKGRKRFKPFNFGPFSFKNDA